MLAIVAGVEIATQDPAERPTAAQVKLRLVGQFDEPVHAASPPGDSRRLFVVEKKGRVQVLLDGRTLGRPFLDISRKVSAAALEEGLLSIAFAPDYGVSGHFYVDYTDRRHRTVVEEYRRSTNPNLADTETARRVLVIANPTDRHHGGLIAFGPDGYLYIGQGDGGVFHDPTFPAQRLDTLHGKILRIDPTPLRPQAYGIPPDNPFVGAPGRDEIWAYGLRNPWRFGFEQPGTLVIGDVGQVRVEEIDVAHRSGLNFGWPCLEGEEPFNADAPRSAPRRCRDLVSPVLTLTRSPAAIVEPSALDPAVKRGRSRARVRFAPADGACSIVTGVVVRDPALPALAGRHLYGDFCNPELRSFRLEGRKAVDAQRLGARVLVLSSFGVDAAGRVYAASLAGPVYRLEAR